MNKDCLYADSGSKKSSPYYTHCGGVPLASKISFYARRKIFDLFMAVVQPGPDTSVLDLGVTSDDTFPESNFFESFYPYPQKITCAGTEDGSHLEARHPGLRFIPVRAGQRLPFRDGEFDAVFSSAVLEHAGGRNEQKFFVSEICRVGRKFFITTPNRWFPVETHTGIPLLHFLPGVCFRRLLKHTRYSFWSHEKNLNLLTLKELKGLFPSTVVPRLEKVRVFGIPSNLVAFGTVPDKRSMENESC
ncbi:MAG TPA: methyltransferase domain-containing protein [Bacillota bacterium]|nr:methyltransferase domain-containing protein [Bacillota bacterium]